MNNEIDEFFQKTRKCIESNKKYLFLARGKEFQEAALQELMKLRDEATVIKKHYIDIKDEESANFVLELECLILGFIKEFEMWILLKEDKPNEAWDSLIASQVAFSYVDRHILGDEDDLKFYYNKLLYLEKLLFPPQLFQSPGGTSKNIICSICGKDFVDCEHISGKKYMGEFCFSLIDDMNLEEISVVDEPADKRNRAFNIIQNGEKRDWMTWGVIEDEDD